MTQRAIDINADVGESFGPWPMGDDATLMPILTSASIACGAHAGDPLVMRRTLALAASAGTAAGAHPGYPDRQGFGRRPMALSPDEVEAEVATQIGALAALARLLGMPLRHVKPHGALYNTAADNAALAEAITRAVKGVDPELVLVARAGSVQVAVARAAGLRVAEEAFADRGYDAQGRLLGRGLPGALIADPAQAAARALTLVQTGQLTAVDGTPLTIVADTLCVHSDSPGAAQIARAVRDALTQAAIPLAPLYTLAR